MGQFGFDPQNTMAAYSVSKRLKGLGIRIAIGAT